MQHATPGTSDVTYKLMETYHTCLAQRWADKSQTQSLLVAGQTTYRWTLTLERKYFFASMNEPRVELELSSQNQSNEDQTNR